MFNLLNSNVSLDGDQSGYRESKYELAITILKEDLVASIALNERQRYGYNDGVGGTGKTFLYEELIVVV